MNLILDNEYWQNRYLNTETGWDIGYAAPAFTAFFDTLSDKNLRILLPGGGHGYEAAALWERGFHNVFLLDWAPAPLENFQKQHPYFPQDQLICGDFFAHEGSYDLILEQTFFCAIDPSLRVAYAQKCASLLADRGMLAGLLFTIIFDKPGPPFGGDEMEYRAVFSPYFHIQKMEICQLSIPPRMNNELFIILLKK